MMARKTIRENFRVEVVPRSVGDFGYVSVSGLAPRKEEEAISACEEIAEQIRRHVDGLPSWRDRGVSVEWDSKPVCEHCGSAWTEDSETYNGGCCSKDEDENDPRT